MPLLFLVHVNDLPECVSVGTNMGMFADDTKFYRELQTTEDPETLQADLDKVTDWCQDWRIELNRSKCGFMHISRSLKPTITQYTICGTAVQQSNHQRDLGIIVSGDLKWNSVGLPVACDKFK